MEKAECNKDLCCMCKYSKPRSDYIPGLHSIAKKMCDEYFAKNYIAKAPHWWSPSTMAHSFAKTIITGKKGTHNLKDAFECESDVMDYFEAYKSALSVFMYHANK